MGYLYKTQVKLGNLGVDNWIFVVRLIERKEERCG